MCLVSLNSSLILPRQESPSMQSPQDGTSPGRFPTSYYPYQNVVNQHLLPPNMSSPSSQGSASTPPNDYHGYSAPSGSKASKRSSSSLAPDNKKRVKQDYADDESASPPAIKDEKIKSTRGSRYVEQQFKELRSISNLY